MTLPGCTPPFCRRVLTLLLLMACALVWGCAQESPEETSPWAVEKKWQRGPVVLHQRLSGTELTIADTLILELESVAEDGVDIRFPRFGKKLDQFIIRDYQTELPRLGQDGLIHQLVRYELEPFLAGDYQVPAMELGFTRNGEDHIVSSEVLTISVRSLMAEDLEKLEIKDIAAPEVVPPPPWPWWLWTVLIGGPLVLIALVFLLVRSRRSKRLAPRIPAHETAYHRLRVLVEKDLVKKGQIKEFYNGVSEILRDYIGDRFKLRAPRRTTEEFLLELKMSAVFEQRLKDLLTRFLVHCDLVKFARHQPEQSDIQAMFDAAKDFIEATRQDLQPSRDKSS